VIKREEVWRIVEDYGEDVTIGVVGSHSALDVLDGAKDEGFKTLVVCQEGREETYKRFKRLVDQIIVLKKFSDIIYPEVQDKLRKEHTVWIPNRSFVVYTGVERIENEFLVPMFGNRSILRIEDREKYEKNYYWLCEKAGIPIPRRFKSPDEIDRLAMVKVSHAKRKVERGFFTCASPKEYYEKVNQLIKAGVIDEKDLKKQWMEEYIVGPVFNFNYFHSLLKDETEFLSIDRRIETNLDGLVRIPAKQQLATDIPTTYLIVGHTAATIRESQIQMVFKMGDQFTKASKEFFPPAVIGPFCLQSIATSNFADLATSELTYYVYDVAVRIGGGTNVFLGVGSQYSKLYYDEPISMGRRVAMEIKNATKTKRLKEIVT